MLFYLTKNWRRDVRPACSSFQLACFRHQKPLGHVSFVAIFRQRCGCFQDIHPKINRYLPCLAPSRHIMTNLYTTAKSYSLITRLWLVLLLSGIFGSSDSQAQITASDFVTTWKTDNPGLTASNQILINASGEYTLYYESIPAGVSGSLPAVGTMIDNQTITFPSPGTYRIAIKPAGATPFHQIFFSGNGDARKLLTIDQWGSTVWSTMQNAFAHCVNLVTLPETDLPNLTNLTNMNSAFNGCASLVGSSRMNEWNVGNVTDMGFLFAGTRAFNQPLGNWNVSNVTIMRTMFSGSVFNQPIDTWNVANVVDMSNMFSNAASFNQPLGNWNVSKVTNMGGMFIAATSFNQPIGTWDVSSVTNTSSMFWLAAAFNQPLAAWNVVNVTTMKGMFTEAAAFNQPIGNWNVGNVKTMQDMFVDATAFNQPLADWDVSQVTTMQQMFGSATAFNQPLDKWTFASNANLRNMLNSSGMDCSNYSTTLVGWANNPANPSNTTFGAVGMTYGSYASDAHDYLVNTKQWTIIGDSFDVNCTVLPVTLISFKVNKQEASAILTWSTAEEANSERFEIQRSSDGKKWQALTSVAASGESEVLSNYRFEDLAPAAGVNYYRLKMIDRDETFAYSPVEYTEFESAARHFLFPNPASDQLVFPDHQRISDVTFYNVGGIKVLQKTGLTAQGIDISKLSPGLYTVLVTLSDGGRYTDKVQVLK